MCEAACRATQAEFGLMSKHAEITDADRERVRKACPSKRHVGGDRCICWIVVEQLVADCREDCAKIADDFFRQKEMRWMGSYIGDAIRGKPREGMERVRGSTND